ncbi:winged helix-turn-helix domain-containing protein [Anatilimnocola sp. NA78]|uniref:winged helix-turn-helix domain-containing protein n=1 Tax=Anatilimnocola sp. NA78 TaxID=3415683 RepID=UPI003CE5B649
MSKKTSTKKPASKTAKAKPAKKAKTQAPATKLEATETKPAGTCPKGGDHEWTDEGAERFCAKCKEPEVAKGKRTKKTKTAKPAIEKKMSALDAAAKLLGETKEPMNTKTMIETIAAKGYWSSPGGKTPHATLYSAILREINTKGHEARFKKTDRGNFAFNG